LYLLIGVMLIFIVVAGWDFFQTRTFDDYILAGRKQSSSLVMMSLLATIIGASATMGASDMAYRIGFPAFWWLTVGAIGLFLQSLLISKKIREMEAYTLPDLARMITGRAGQVLTGLIIVLAWTGIIAAQFVAVSSITAFLCGGAESTAVIIITALLIIIYTALGGQYSIIKTDALQFILLAAGILYTLYYLFFSSEMGTIIPVLTEIEFLNPSFTGFNLIYFIFIVGSTYFIGPDIFSRNFLARDGITARRATFKACILLLLFSLFITLIGLWAKVNIPDLEGLNALVYIMSYVLPRPGAILLALALLAAILSSTDTCLLTASAIIENDLLGQKRIANTRLFVIIIGCVSLLIALLKSDIISLLLSAYSVFAPGIVCPLFIAIWYFGKKQLNSRIWLLAVIIGGILGLSGSISGSQLLPLIGMGLSLLIAFASVSR